MFHCNGWCFTWAVTAAGGTHLCLRKFDPALIWKHLRESGVTHFNARADHTHHAGVARRRRSRSRAPCNVATGGAPPTPALLRAWPNST